MENPTPVVPAPRNNVRAPRLGLKWNTQAPTNRTPADLRNGSDWLVYQHAEGAVRSRCQPRPNLVGNTVYLPVAAPDGRYTTVRSTQPVLRLVGTAHTLSLTRSLSRSLSA